jgi:hypothetical protein
VSKEKWLNLLGPLIMAAGYYLLPESPSLDVYAVAIACGGWFLCATQMN